MIKVIAHQVEMTCVSPLELAHWQNLGGGQFSLSLATAPLPLSFLSLYLLRVLCALAPFRFSILSPYFFQVLCAVPRIVGCLRLHIFLFPDPYIEPYMAASSVTPA
jgi:hypothetical protein